MTDCIVLWFQARFQNIFKDGAEETKRALRRNFWKNFMFIYVINVYTAINQLNICYNIIVSFFLSSLYFCVCYVSKHIFCKFKGGGGATPIPSPFDLPMGFKLVWTVARRLFKSRHNMNEMRSLKRGAFEGPGRGVAEYAIFFTSWK